ncbi:MAG: PorV/PorQ family protein [Bacteroidales bacterium]|nr:PorV/PorQ family protein [Bacteroidales bacterium]MCF6341815.1 PorV/PorQ family protein [Bacteroidales bacterium]
MKQIYKYLAIGLVFALIFPVSLVTLAGNKDRSGQAGASELLINPWARSSGWGSANMAKVKGLEAMWGNVAGVAFTNGTQVIFSHTQWLKGSGTTINAFGVSQRLGETGVLGISVMSMGFGEIEITTTDSPDGGLGVYKPNLMNIALSYSKSFSNSIYGGILVKIITESIADVSAVGIAIDMGIQYVTGENDQLAFGISLKNVGPKMQFSGDGLSLRAFIPGQETQFTLEQRSEAFEIPAQLNIGLAYDFLFPKEFRLTMAGNFTSNSFTKDQFALGLEFAFKNIIMIRGGYTYENGMWDDINSTTKTNVSSGLSAGITLNVPLNKEKGSYIGIDYSFRETVAYDNNHTFGLIFNF